MTTSPAQKRATVNHRTKRRRIEIMMHPESPESAALDRLAKIYGSQAAGIRFALLEATKSGLTIETVANVMAVGDAYAAGVKAGRCK